MRGHDWGQSPLGAPSAWPQSLRSVVGLLLNSRFPMFVAWGVDLGLLYNDAYAEILGDKHPQALGARFQDIWSEIWSDIAPLIDAAIAGEASYRENMPLTVDRRGFDEKAWFTFSYSPVRDESGAIAGMFCAVSETTAHVLGERRRDALLKLDDRLRDTAATAELSFVASELLGQVLGAVRVGYGTLDPCARTIAVERNWSAPGYADVAGTHQFDDYGTYVDDLLNGHAVANADVETDPRTAAKAAAFRALDVSAHLDVPVLENGRAVGQMFVHSAEPRIWTDEEIAFVRDFAERTRAAIARRTAEIALQQSEDRQAFLLGLTDALRPLTSPADMIEVATARLGERVSASRVFYAEYLGSLMRVERDYTRGVGSLVGEHDLAAFGPQLLRAYHECEVVKVDDIEADERFTEAARVGLRAREVGAYLDVVLAENEHWVAVLAVQSATPRAWTPAEEQLVREVGERLRSAVARASSDAALRRSEERLRAVFDQASAGLACTDLTGRFTEVNDRYCAIVGRSREELLTLRMQDLTHPDDLTSNIPLFETIVAGGPPFEIEKRYLRPDGSSVWVRNSVGAVRSAEGKVESALTVCVDLTQKRLAEARQRESEARFRGVFDSALMGFTIFDANSGKTLAINDTFLAMTGHSRADFDEGRWDWREFTVEDHLALDEAAVAQARERGWWDAYEKEYFRRNGSRFPVRLSSAPMPGEPGRVVVGIEDITNERAAEAALRESEARLRLALEGARLGTWVWDLRTMRGSWSPRTMEILGVDHGEDIMPEQRSATIHPDDRDRVWRELAEALQSGDELFSEYRAVTPNGEVKWIASRGAVQRDESGVPLRASGIVLDVTERRAAEAALHRLNETLEAQVAERTAELTESQRRFRGIFDSALQFMALLEPDGTVMEVNRTALDWSRIEAAEIVGKPFWLADPLRGNPALQAAIKAGIQRAAAGETVREEHEMRGAGDVRALVDFSLKPVPGEDGKTLWLVAEGRDITALKEAQEALRQSQKMEAMGQLTGGVAHDFNNLLTPIVGSLDMLERSLLGSERERRLIDGALQSAERARVLVQRLLAFARRQPLQPKPVDIGALVSGMADLVASTTGPQIKVVVNVADGLPAAVADPNQLEMAILNLSVNARDAMEGGGTLRISADAATVDAGNPADLRPGRYVRLSVADTGIGMDDATLARATEPFFSTKGVGRGTGLGLSMVHGLASQLGGALTIQSRPGLGTNIEIWLPASSAEVSEPSGVEDLGPRAGPAGTALLVDDEVLVRASTADMLSDLGYAVVEAGSAEEALRLLDSGLEPELLVSDHLMPGTTGTELAREVRTRRPGTRVLVVSGYADVDGIAPDLPRLTKPYRQADLAAKLRELDDAPTG